MSKPSWDDGHIDKGIRRTVGLINQLPHVETISSCEGHLDFPVSHILFLYKGKLPIPWAKRLLKSGLRTPHCLGCLRLELVFDYHFDCSNTLMSPMWWLRIVPRRDYSSKRVKTDMLDVWGEINKEIEKILKEEQCTK